MSKSILPNQFAIIRAPSEPESVCIPWFGETVSFLADSDEFLDSRFKRYGHLFRTKLNLSGQWYQGSSDTICVKRSPDVRIHFRHIDFKLERFKGRLSTHLPKAREVGDMLVDLYLNDNSILLDWEEEIHDIVSLNLESLLYETNPFTLDLKLKELSCDLIGSLFFTFSGLGNQLLGIMLRCENEMNNTDNLVDFAQSSFKDLGVLIFLGLREEKRKLSSNQTFARQQQSRPQFVLTALFEDTKSCLKEIETSLPSKSKYGKNTKHEMSDNEVVECMLIFLTECLYFPLVQSLHFICYTVLQTNEQDWKQLLRYRYENYQASLQHLGYLNEKTIKRFSWLNSLNMSVANNNKHNSKFEGEQNSPPRGRKKSSSQSKQVPKQFINPNTVREALKSPISSILQAAFGNKSEDEVVMDSDEDENVNDYDPFSDEDDKDETIDWFELEQKSNQSNQENRALQSEYIESPYDDSETSSVATEDYHQVSKTGSYARSPHKQLPEESHTGMTNKMQVYSGDEYFKIVKHDPRLYSNLLSYIGVVHEVIRTAQSKCLLAARSCKRKNEFAIFSALGSTVMETFKTLKMSEGQRGGQEVGQVYSTHPISKGEQIMVVTDDAPSMNRCMTTNFHQLVSCIFLNKLSTGYSFTLRPMGNAHMTPTTIIVEKVTARQSIDLFIPQKLSHQDFHSQPEQNNTSSCAKEKKLIDLSSYFNLSKAKKEDPVEVEDTRYFSDGL